MPVVPGIPPRAHLQRRFVEAFADPSAGRAPVPAAELRDAEERLGVVFPAAYTQFLLAFGPVDTPAIRDKLLAPDYAGPPFPFMDGLLGPSGSRAVT